MTSYPEGVDMSWTCRCGETHDDSFEACWNCGSERTNQSQSASATPGSMPSAPSLDDSRRCPHCGRLISRPSTRCSHCLEKVPVGTQRNEKITGVDVAQAPPSFA